MGAFARCSQGLVAQKLHEITSAARQRNSSSRAPAHAAAGGGGGVQAALAVRVHEVHDPTLEDLFEIGGACTRVVVDGFCNTGIAQASSSSSSSSCSSSSSSSGRSDAAWRRRGRADLGAA